MPPRSSLPGCETSQRIPARLANTGPHRWQSRWGRLARAWSSMTGWLRGDWISRLEEGRAVPPSRWCWWRTAWAASWWRPGPRTPSTRRRRWPAGAPPGRCGAGEGRRLPPSCPAGARVAPAVSQRAVGSRDDPYCRPAAPPVGTADWGAAWVDYGARPHQRESGLGDWPEGWAGCQLLADG